MTVRELKRLKKPSEGRKPEQKVPDSEPDSGKQEKKLPEPEPVATSQQMPEGTDTVSREAQPLLSAYGLPVLEYPPGSLLSSVGCGQFGGVLYHCFSCHMNHCQIRGADCYCVEAPVGNPFPCMTLWLMEQETARQEVGDRCPFVNHDLADHRAGDHSAVPCCKDCDNPCEFRCTRAVGKLPEEAAVDGDFREVEALPEDDEDASEKTDRELAQIMLDKEKQTLKMVSEEFAENEEYARKQHILVAALEDYICGLDIQQDQEAQDQPELPVLRNNDQRKEWLRNYRDRGIWYRDENIGAEYYKYDFANGARLIAEVYQEPKTEYCGAYESCHLHLVGGPKPPRNGSAEKWTRHEHYSRYPNSETELVEFLKEVQRGQK